jgi:hypothetical protein
MKKEKKYSTGTKFQRQFQTTSSTSPVATRAGVLGRATKPPEAEKIGQNKPDQRHSPQKPREID